MEEQKILEPTQLNAMIEKLKVAREDDTPHAVYGNGGEIAVVGDANKTDVKTIDIEVSFRFTEKEIEEHKIDVPENAKRVGQYVMFDNKFENLTLSPRQDIKMVEALIEVKPLLLDAEKIMEPYQEKFQEIEEYYGHKFIKGKEGIVTTDADDEEVNKTMVQIYEAYMNEADEQIFHLYAKSSTNLVDGLYKVVAIFLGLDEFYEDHMMQYSVLTCMISLIIKYPELFNEVETVFIK